MEDSCPTCGEELDGFSACGCSLDGALRQGSRSMMPSLGAGPKPVGYTHSMRQMVARKLDRQRAEKPTRHG